MRSLAIEDKAGFSALPREESLPSRSWKAEEVLSPGVREVLHSYPEMSVLTAEVKVLTQPAPACQLWVAPLNSSFSSEVKGKVANHCVPV